MTILTSTAISGFTYVLGTSDDSINAGLIVLVFLGYFCCLAILWIPYLVGLWKVFEKAGQPAWQSLIPYLNNCVMARITDVPWWWGLVPFLNLVPLFKLAKAFGKSDAYGIGLIFLSFIFVPMLGFGKAQYLMEQQPPLF